MKLRRGFIPRHLICCLWLAVVLAVPAVDAAAATVRGKLAMGNANTPAVGMAVTVYSKANGRSSAARTGPAGMYYLYNVPVGSAYLEVWASKNPRDPPKVYPIRVVNPYTDIQVIVLP